MNSKNVMAALAFVTVMSVLLIVSVQAAPKPTVTQDSFNFTTSFPSPSVNTVEYTQTSIALGGALNVIRVPDGWNGNVVVICRDYVTQDDFDPNAIPVDQESEIWLSKGFATAASNYGQGGMCIQKATIMTRLLTQYVLDHYNVTGKVNLAGFSMGGSVALLLGEKYPDVYSSVLDVCSPKDYAAQYTTQTQWASLSNADLTAALTALNLSVPSDLDAFRSSLLQSASDIAIECGGTPEENPTAYQRISPLYHVDMKIPTIFVVAMSDAEVLIQQNYDYYNAIQGAGKGGLVHVSPTTHAEHLDEIVMFGVSSTFNALQYRVNHGMWLPTVVCFVGC